MQADQNQSRLLYFKSMVEFFKGLSALDRTSLVSTGFSKNYNRMVAESQVGLTSAEVALWPPQVMFANGRASATSSYGELEISTVAIVRIMNRSARLVAA